MFLGSKLNETSCDGKDAFIPMSSVRETSREEGGIHLENDRCLGTSTAKRQEQEHQVGCYILQKIEIKLNALFKYVTNNAFEERFVIKEFN